MHVATTGRSAMHTLSSDPKSLATQMRQARLQHGAVRSEQCKAAMAAVIWAADAATREQSWGSKEDRDLSQRSRVSSVNVALSTKNADARASQAHRARAWGPLI